MLESRAGMKDYKRYFGVSALAFLLLGACTLPRPDSTPTTLPIDQLQTSAALTVQANPLQITATGESTSASTATLSATGTLAPTNTIPPTTGACDVAAFMSDVTVPDGTKFAPGEGFTKVWRLRNNGTCTWNADYRLVFDSGDAMGGPASKPFTSGTVAPDQEVDVEVDLTAPATPGTYRGNWKLRNDSGVIFGLSNGGPFWVEIEVASPISSPTPTPIVVYSLFNNAPSAVWITSTGTISFGGPDTDTDGFAMYKNDERLEDGSTPSKVLEMHPAWQDNGVITGRFADYTIQNGDHFIAKIGFLAKADGSCGVGSVQFQFNYKIGDAGAITPIDSWNKSCDGDLIDIDIDLSYLAGTTVKLILGVLANGSSSQDWAVWVNPRIVR